MRRPPPPRRGALAEGVAQVRQTQVRTAFVTRPPARCNSCQARRVAWVRPRVDFCYDCLPGGPFTPPACRKCASPDRYFSEGLCDRCHPGAPLHLGSCRDCLAWGVYQGPQLALLESAGGGTPTTRSATANTAAGTPASASSRRAGCASSRPARVQEPGRAIDLVRANLYGQQLFLANMRFQRPRTPRLKPQPYDRRAASGFRPLQWHQLALFDMDPDPAVVRERALARRQRPGPSLHWRLSATMQPSTGGPNARPTT